MATKTKMIIITSDEDLIRQIALTKKSNTRIVELDHPNEVSSTNQDENDIIDLAFLADISAHNPRSDQVYKRALDSPHQTRSKQMKYAKKSADLVCAICGDRAVGFNYDALSCASCKAFFRRNAHQSREKLRCFTNQGQCSVAHDVHRKCPRCRLDRCFSVGMRKDFILSEEEKQRRKKRLEENRSATAQQSFTSSIVSNIEPIDDFDRLLLDIDQTKNEDSIGMENLLFGTLSIEDWLTIESVRSSFLSMFQNLHPCQFVFDTSDQTSALVSWSQNTNQIALSFITFFRHIDEFENLDYSDDRLLLIKHNLLSVFPIFKCYLHKTAADHCTSAEEEKHRQFYKLCGDSSNILDGFIEMKLILVALTEQDPAVLSILMTILLFTDRLSMDENQRSLNDPIAVSRAQSHYTRILWNYIVNKKGEHEAYKYFIQVLAVIFRIQKLSHRVRTFFRTQFITSNIVDKIAPLMQTVLNIT
ncbi:hypothetical protein I4U23_003471 [Adineta vaga]|nr:hypothetical protein I4U23_003471 [Adineta vaga]